MKKILTKKYYIILVVLLIVSGAYFFSGNGNGEQEYFTVSRGNLAQELFETGSTEKGDDISLSFKESGKIESVFVKEGEIIKRGDVVAVLDKRDLNIALREAEAGLSSFRATLDGVLNPIKKEDVELYEARVSSAKTALSVAEDGLREQKRISEEEKKIVHQNTPVLLGNVYQQVKDIEIGVVRIAREYFSSMVATETTSGRRSRDAIKRITVNIEQYKELAIKSDVGFEEKNSALEETEKELRAIIRELDNLISVAESDFYKDRFLKADVDLLRLYRSTANNVLGEVVAHVGLVSTTSVKINADITRAEGAVSSAKSNLSEAERALSQVKASPRSSDIRAREADIKQAEARIDLLRNRIADTTLTSPVAGVVSNVLARSSEVVAGGSPVVVISPEEEMQVGIDIYEGDISKVKIGDRIKAKFVAFPDEEFEGEVVFINPTGRIIDGVIYYAIKIMLDEYPEKVLPQMTVDITIKTAQREDVLLVPERVIYRKDGKEFVQIIANGELKEAEIETGLRGEGRMVEIISGLSEGDRLLLEI